ncbi:unnamed protein product, partial [Ectocarpus sp. 12 AP-2014]
VPSRSENRDPSASRSLFRRFRKQKIHDIKQKRKNGEKAATRAAVSSITTLTSSYRRLLNSNNKATTAARHRQKSQQHCNPNHTTEPADTLVEPERLLSDTLTPPPPKNKNASRYFSGQAGHTHDVRHHQEPLRFSLRGVDGEGKGQIDRAPSPPATIAFLSPTRRRTSGSLSRSSTADSRSHRNRRNRRRHRRRRRRSRYRTCRKGRAPCRSSSAGGWPPPLAGSC